MNEETKYICTTKRKPLVIGDETFFPATEDVLTDKEMENARLKLGETEDKRNECLQELKRKLSSDEGVEYLMDDYYLLRYLRFRKFNCDESYKMMKHFYAQKIKHPEVFSVPSNMETLLNYHAFYYMPYADEQGRIVFMSDFARWDPEEVPFIDALSAMTSILDITTMIPKCQVNGIVTIWDTKGLNTRQVSEFLSPSRIMLFLSVIQGCFPMRIKLGIGINCNALVRMVFKVVAPFMKKKIRKRVVLLGSDLNELHKYVSPFILPKTLGGTLDEEECRINQDILINLPFLRYERTFTPSPYN